MNMRNLHSWISFKNATLSSIVLGPSIYMVFTTEGLLEVAIELSYRPCVQLALRVEFIYIYIYIYTHTG